MNRGLCTLLLAAHFAAPVLAGCSAEEAGSLTARTGEPIVHCVQHDPDTREAMAEGRQRLLISVTSYEPADEGEIGFEVFILEATGERRAQVDRFGVHPLQGFDVEDGDEPHHFLVSLAPYGEHLGAEETCFELAFASERLEGEPGSARVSFSLQVTQPPDV